LIATTFSISANRRQNAEGRHGREAEQPGVVTEVAGEGGLADGLVRPPDDAGDADKLCVGGSLLLPLGVRAIEFFRAEAQHRLEQPDLRVADGELGRVHADGQAANARGGVVADQGALPALVELAGRVQRQRHGGDGDAAVQRLMNRRFQHSQSSPTLVRNPRSP
jgi:hypothetical protein